MEDFRKKIIVFSLVIVVGLGGTLVFNVFLFQQLKTLSSELSFTKSELAVLTERSSQMSLWEKEAPALEEELREVENVFVNPEMPLSFLDFVERSAEESDLIYNISLLESRGKRGESFSPLEIRVDAKGGFPSCLKLLDYIENSPYLVRSKSLIFSSSEKGAGEEVRMELLIEVLTYEGSKG